MTQLQCRDLKLGYESHIVAQNISFDVNAGDYLCIVGENGTGKSTLMKTILGLIPPKGGTITTAPGIKQSDIGYLPQQTVVQRDFPASVEEIVISGCQGRKGFLSFYSKEDKAMARASMERMHITGLAKRCYRELSGGQQQRVLLARALCAAKNILLLDEPVSGLDPNVTEQMYELIETLNGHDGMTIIMISHDLAASAKYATHVLHMGKYPYYGSIEDSEIQSLLKAHGQEAEHNA